MSDKEEAEEQMNGVEWDSDEEFQGEEDEEEKSGNNIIKQLKDNGLLFNNLATKKSRMKELMQCTDKVSITDAAVLQLCAAEQSLVDQVLDSMGLDELRRRGKKRLQIYHLQNAIQGNEQLQTLYENYKPSSMEKTRDMTEYLEPAKFNNLHDMQLAEDGESLKYYSADWKVWEKERKKNPV